jgi:hypothetical protein
MSGGLPVRPSKKKKKNESKKNENDKTPTPPSKTPPRIKKGTEYAGPRSAG